MVSVLWLRREEKRLSKSLQNNFGMNQLLHAVNFFLLRREEAVQKFRRQLWYQSTRTCCWFFLLQREEKRLCKSLENNSGINQLLHAVDFLLLRREEKRLCKSLENNSSINQFLHAVGALFFFFFFFFLWMLQSHVKQRLACINFPESFIFALFNSYASLVLTWPTRLTGRKKKKSICLPSD